MAIIMLKKILTGILLFQSSHLIANQATSTANEEKILSNGSIAVLKINDFSNNKSINQFKTFNLTGNNLTIYSGNAPTTTESQIIISAPSIQLRNSHIKIIGKPVDIVFQSTAAGTHDVCQSCTIENAKRITFVNSSSTFWNNGLITTDISRNMRINNVYAPGAQAVEFLAGNITLNGVVNTNLQAESHPAGGFIIAPGGSQVVGTGGVNFYSGALQFDYPSSAIKGATAVTSALQLNGTVSAAAVTVAAAGDITIAERAVLDTNSDFISSSSRNNAPYIPQEGIYLQNLKASPSDNRALHMNLSGKLLTDYNLSIKSVSSVSLAANVIAKKMQMIAATHVYQRGYIQATDLQIAADVITNTGYISAANLRFDAVNDIANTMGGHINASTVAMKSTAGSFLNGARNSVMTIPTHLKSELIAPVTNINQKTQGIFFKLQKKDAQSASVTARIFADKISISAVNIENINPYYIDKAEQESWDNGVRLEVQKANQVSLTAEDNMELAATGYILNSSAILGQSNVDGNFHMNTPHFYNQRYKTDANSFILNTTSRDANQKVRSATSVETSKVGTETVLISYSPAGRLYSYGKFYFSDGIQNNTTKESFNNDISYVELLNSSYFHNTNLISTGYLISTSFKGDTTTARNCLIKEYCKGDMITVHTTIDTLLSFKGNVYGISDTAKESNLSINNIDVSDNIIKDYLFKHFKDKGITPNDEGQRLDLISGYYYYSTTECKPIQQRKPTEETYVVIEDNYNEHCETTISSIDLRELLKINNPNYNGVKYSEDKINAAVRKYISSQPLNVNRADASITKTTLKESGITADKKSITIVYYHEYSYQVEKYPDPDKYMTPETMYETVNGYAPTVEVTLELDTLMQNYGQ